MKLFLTLLTIAVVTMADEKTAEELLTAGNNQFTYKMFSEVTHENPGKSVILSAYSVLTPLAQLSLASEGATHDELLKAIGMPDDATIKEVFSLANKRVRAIKGVDLRTASRIYIPNNYELNEDYNAVSRNVFDSDAKQVDFAKNKETAAEINTWVEDNTNHKIKDLVDPSSLDDHTRAVLVNAIYFKGSWKDPFDESLTKDSDFYISKDNKVQVPTMFRTGSYSYGESAELDAKLLRLPYEGEEASMLIVLPNKVDGLAELEEKLKDPEALTKATQSMATFEVEVSLPKFKIETRTDLKKVLEAIGVKTIFDMQNAKINKLLKGQSDLYVSEAIQKAFIEVNEKGAEAAAANEFVVLPGATLPRFFEADRPFYFSLNVDNVNIISGRLLF